MAAIIFDFDGTIADSFDVIVEVFEILTKRDTHLSAAEIEEMRGMPLSTVARKMGIPFWKLPWLLLRGRYLMGQRLQEITVFEGMSKVIEELYAEGHTLFIVSSNSTRNVRRFAKQHHLYKYFVEIRGGAGLLGKPRILRRLLRRNSLKTEECVYIGDETRDVLSAKAVGMRCIAVTWGFANLAFLEEMKPTALAHKPQDIVRILEEL